MNNMSAQEILRLHEDNLKITAHLTKAKQTLLDREDEIKDLQDQLAQAQEALDLQIPKGCLEDLQQKLLASQASELMVRKAVTEYVIAVNQRALHPDIKMRMDKALSTPPNTAELEAYVESKIEKRLGEPVAWINNAGFGIDSHVTATSFKDDYHDYPLYAKKG